MSWRDAGPYAFDPPLTGAEWAWQFLRRNPGYQSDYAWFIATWRALEADYGAPPQRDFFRWRQDPRAWRAETELGACAADACPGEADQVLIECWMGAKWGLRKFPPDPALERPEPGVELDWREQALAVREVAAIEDPSSEPGTLTLAFDLGLPLAAQLDDARVRLVARRRALERAGALPERTVRAAGPRWTCWLRLLDGAAAGAKLDELAAALRLDDAAGELVKARAMTISGYRRILLMD